MNYGTGYGREPKVWKLGKEALALMECDKIDGIVTRCNWCEAGQEGNFTDTCTSCKKQGYLMDYKGERE